MDELNNIFGKPTFINGIGNVYPIMLTDWTKFSFCSPTFLFRLEHFNNRADNMTLFDCLMRECENDERFYLKFRTAIHMVLRTDDITVGQVDGEYRFVYGEEYEINRDNYDELRKVVMEQNLMIEPKIYKNKLMQKWAEMALKARSSKGIEMTFEDKITTLACWDGKKPTYYKDYTYYQFEAMFQRMCQFKNFDSQSIMMANPYAAESVSKSMEHFAQSINLRKDPYDDVFVKEDNSKLGRIKNSLK
ncbi:hypothetical protein WKH56_20840 [Priestia sp. SB1]|uniref:hypothetical protein n=1 Tax=Priestia sp. SB1 TaxID=3132359 RepID=UPI00316E642B